MLDPKLRAIAELQASQALSAPVHRLQPDTRAHELRIAAVEDGLIDATMGELNYRQLFPALDRGVYCAHHAVGRPSAQLVPALRSHFGALEQLGIEAFEQGWQRIEPRFSNRVRALLGVDRGEVLHTQGIGAGFATLLSSGLGGRLVMGAEHGETALRVQRAWADRCGIERVELAADSDGWVTTAQYVDALTPDTTLVSIPSCHGRTGQVHDLRELSAAMARMCPDAALLIDTSHSLTVAPIDLGEAPPRLALLGDGLGQVHAGVGCGFVCATPELIDSLDAAVLRADVPDLTAMAVFLAETDLLLSLGADPLARIHERIGHTRTAALEAARESGLTVVGEPGAALIAIRTEDGEDARHRARERGVIVDFAPDTPGSKAGVLRLSTAPSGFAYELLFALDAIR